MSKATLEMRDLLCAGINEIVEKGLLDLESENISENCYYTTLFSKKTKIYWCEISHKEVSIVLWWGLKETIKDSNSTLPGNKKRDDGIDLSIEAWIERKDGIWLQGNGEHGIVVHYCSQKARKDLFSIPIITPKKYSKEGQFYC